MRDAAGWFLVIFLTLYGVPAVVAAVRQVRHQYLVCFLAIGFGWLVLPWFALLAYACFAQSGRQRVEARRALPSPPPRRPGAQLTIEHSPYVSRASSVAPRGEVRVNPGDRWR